MFARPDDLDDALIIEALSSRWGLDATTLDYVPLGFGSHHWRASTRDGELRFVTVDDLDAKRLDGDTSADDAFARLTRVFGTVRALHDDAGLAFVVAPLEDRRGGLVARLDDRYSMIVHPYLEGRSPGGFEGYDSAADRAAVLAHLVELHASTDLVAAPAHADDLPRPHRDATDAALAAIGSTWDAGPYSERAGALLAANEGPLRSLLVAYDELAASVGAHRERMVITHGEPHAGNVFVVDDCHLLIDWDTALIAAPERDLWVLDPGDGSILEAYRRATGVSARPEALDLYRLWFDLDEIGGYLEALRRPHRDDDNTAQMWVSLVVDLDLEVRWPTLIG